MEKQDEKEKKHFPETKEFIAGRAADAQINITIGAPHTEKLKGVPQRALQAFFYQQLQSLVALSNDLELDRIVIDFSNTSAKNKVKTQGKANMIFVDLLKNTMDLKQYSEEEEKEDDGNSNI